MADEGMSPAAAAAEAIGDDKSSARSTQSLNQVPAGSEVKKTPEKIDDRNQKMHETLSWLLQWPLIMHAAFVLTILWLMGMLGINYPVVYVIGFIFLFLVESRHHEKMVKRIRYEERRHAVQKQLLSDFEPVRWLNHTLEKAWPVFLEKFASKDFLAPLMPYFIEKHKPWTVQDVSLQSFHLGRTPPFFAGLRAVDSSATDDDLVLEASMQFVGAEDMSAVLSVQLKKRLGGITTKLHISKLHIEGKVRIGIKFQDGWPFVNRLRISFDGAPYLQIEARPLTNYGMDVAELPGIAGWLDTMLMDALEDSLVKPNMLVINVEKIASSWGSSEIRSPPVGKALPVAYAKVEIIEASQLKAADVNGLADPFVKLTLNATRCKTNIKWKTLSPAWREEFLLPVHSWDVQNRLIFQVRDKDTFRDDNLGYWDESLAKLRDGNRHEACVPLRGVKTGRLTFAITIQENPQEDEGISPSVVGSATDMGDSYPDDAATTPLAGDQVEIIDTGVSAPGIFSILRPGKAVQKRWQGRKGRKFDEAIEIPDNTLFSGSLDRESSGDELEKDKDNKPTRKRFWRWSNSRDLRARERKGFSGELLTVNSDSGPRVDLRTVLDNDTPGPDVLVPVEELQRNGSENLEHPEEHSEEQNKDKVPTTVRGPESTETETETETLPYQDRDHDHGRVHDHSETSPPREEDHHHGDASVRSNDALDYNSDTHQVSPGRRSMRERARSAASHISHSLWKKKSGRVSP